MAFFKKDELEKLRSGAQNDTKQRILVVDDEDHNLQVIKAILKQDYHVLMAHDGKEALELLEKSVESEPIDLIISDQRMPNMAGVELLEKSCDISPDTVRIILTAFTDVEVIIDAINCAHVHQFMRKPYERRDIETTIQNALAARTLAEHPRQMQLNSLLVQQQQKLQEASETISYLATTDALTGVANRRHFIQQANQLLKQGAYAQHTASLLLLDIDYFKKINDQYGQAVGDDVLSTLAELIDGNLREPDLCGRLEGGAFAILLPDTDKQAALAFAERLREQLASIHIESEKAAINVTASIGFALVPSGDSGMDTALQHAEEALREAKNTGRNRVYG